VASAASAVAPSARTTREEERAGARAAARREPGATGRAARETDAARVRAVAAMMIRSTTGTECSRRALGVVCVTPLRSGDWQRFE